MCLLFEMKSRVDVFLTIKNTHDWGIILTLNNYWDFIWLTFRSVSRVSAQKDIPSELSKAIDDDNDGNSISKSHVFLYIILILFWCLYITQWTYVNFLFTSRYKEPWY